MRRSLAMLALVCSGMLAGAPRSARAATEYGKTVYMDDVSVGSWTARVSDVSICTTNGGTYTNGVTWTNTYRFTATNLLGRIPATTNYTQIFTGDTNGAGTTAVYLAWSRYEGVSDYVIERSLDAGTTWTQYVTVAVSTTNWSDLGTNTWSAGSVVSNVSLIPEPSVPWTDLGGADDLGDHNMDSNLVAGSHMITDLDQLRFDDDIQIKATNGSAVAIGSNATAWAGSGYKGEWNGAGTDPGSLVWKYQGTYDDGIGEPDSVNPYYYNGVLYMYYRNDADRVDPPPTSDGWCLDASLGEITEQATYFSPTKTGTYGEQPAPASGVVTVTAYTAEHVFQFGPGCNETNRTVNYLGNRIADSNGVAIYPGDGGVDVQKTPTGTVVTVSYAAQNSYPVLKLDIGNVDANWTDFEIKASTNNFTNLVYHVKSWTAVTTGNQDTNVWVYYTDDYAPDVRAWIKATNEVAISDQLINAANSVVRWVYVYPSHDCSYDWSLWMSKTNARLVWSYVRVDPLGYQTNATGTAQSWNPVRPDEWENERTVP